MTTTEAPARVSTTVPLNWNEVWFTNCPMVSANNVDQELGWCREEFKKIGVEYAYFRHAPENNWYPHYIHNLDNLIRFGGLFRVKGVLEQLLNERSVALFGLFLPGQHARVKPFAVPRHHRRQRRDAAASRVEAAGIRLGSSTQPVPAGQASRSIRAQGERASVSDRPAPQPVRRGLRRVHPHHGAQVQPAPPQTGAVGTHQVDLPTRRIETRLAHVIQLGHDRSRRRPGLHDPQGKAPGPTINHQQ